MRKWQKPIGYLLGVGLRDMCLCFCVRVAYEDDLEGLRVSPFQDASTFFFLVFFLMLSILGLCDDHGGAGLVEEQRQRAA